MSHFSSPARRFVAIGALLGATALVSPAQAQAVWTNGSGNNQWGTGANWSTGAAPENQTGQFSGAGGTVDLGGNNFVTEYLDIQTSGYTFEDGTMQLGYDTPGIHAGADTTFASSLTLDFQSRGVIDVSSGATLTVNGDIDGAGFEKTGDGTLDVSGTVQGDVLVSDGTLALGYGAVEGNVELGSSGRLQTVGLGTIGSLSGTGVVDLGYQLSIKGSGTEQVFSGTITGSNGIYYDGASNGPVGAKQTFTGHNTYTGDTYVNSGTLVGSSTSFGTGNMTINPAGHLVFDQATDGTFGQLIQGSGSLQKTGAGSLTLAGTNSFSGATTVSDGTLVVSGSLVNSTITVEDGARLSGSGAIGATTIEAGGVHAPGAASQLVDGDYANHGTLQIAGSTSSLSVQGGVDLTGATLSLFLSPNSLASWNLVNGPFTIIDNDGADAVVGQFASVVDNFAFLTTSLDYAGGSGNDVDLSLTRNGTTFAAVGATGNQVETANAVEQLGPGNAVWNAVAVLSAGQARYAFEQLSGDAFASQQGAQVQGSANTRDMVMGRLRTVTSGSDQGVLSYVDTGSDAYSNAKDGLVWGSAYGSRAFVEGNGNAADSRSASGGFLAGADDWFGDVRLGIMFNAGRSGVMTADRRAGVESNDYGLGIYGGTRFGATSLSFGAAYQRHDYSSTRVVGFPGFVERLTADYSGGTGQVFGEVAHEFDFGAVELQPFAQMAYVHDAREGFTETGGASALTVSASSNDALFTTIGTRASAQFAIDDATLLTLTGGIGWRHAFADAPVTVNSFAGGTSFAVSGAPIAANALVLEAGVDVDLNDNLTLGLAYDGQFSGGASDHGVSADFGVKF